jgi:Double zinc ribbon
MDCRSCGVVNAPGRRYCRECGARLGQSCPVCHFFNAVEDKHCGGCGRRLKAAAGPLATEVPVMPAYAPALAGDVDFNALGVRVPPPADASIGGQGVSQSEIDGLFENILDEEPGQPGEGDA